MTNNAKHRGLKKKGMKYAVPEIFEDRENHRLYFFIE